MLVNYIYKIIETHKIRHNFIKCIIPLKLDFKLHSLIVTKVILIFSLSSKSFSYVITEYRKVEILRIIS
jgi:hypothetical protein